jgi:hypothetical protein
MKIKTQPDNYSCGIYSIINSLIVYGDSYTREEAKEVSGTTYRNGTSEKGIQHALSCIEYSSKEYLSKQEDHAWRWVLKNSTTSPLILIVDKNEHWRAVIGRIRNKGSIIGDKYTQIVDKSELLARWKSSDGFYGLKVSF